MSITIHFFRNRSLERIDYEKLIEELLAPPFVIVVKLIKV